MEILLQLVVAVFSVAVAVYAHSRIAHFTAGRAKVALARAVLIVVGVGFGTLMAAGIQDQVLQWLVFLNGFGIVHFPAAIILFIKGRRGSGQS